VAALAALGLAPLARADDDVDASRELEDIRTLASDAFEGRASGSPGGEKAAEYIEKELRSAGLAPIRQGFDFTSGVAVGPKSAMTLCAGGEERALRAKEDFTPLGFSSNGEAVGPVVFVGHGITAPEAHYDDYAGIAPVKGKIVIALDGVPRAKDPHTLFHEGLIRYAQVRYKAMNAREHGAAALVMVATESEDPSLLSVGQPGTYGDAGIVVVDLRRKEAEKLFAGVGRSLRAIDELIDRDLAPHSIELPGVSAKITAEVLKEKKTTANILAVLEGADPALKGETIVVGAHYDHLGRGETGGSLDPHPGKEIHNGADDNASGTAALLEVARALARGPRPRRTVVFAAFSGEELGLLGSAHYVKEPIRPLAGTVAMVNMDMVGRMRGRKITIGGVGTAAEWPPLVRRAAQAVGLEVALDDEGYGPSDHSSFYGKGVPVLFLFTGAHADYHKPSDDADKINAEGEALATRLALALIRGIDAMDGRPTYEKTKGSPHGGELEPGRGPSVYLGTIPDYADTAKPGVRLAGVREGSPAESAGLRGGDLIVRFDGKEVRDIQDYTYALFSKKPGDKVEIVVERDGAGRLTLKATLGKKDR
jgi:hypothetical protein